MTTKIKTAEELIRDNLIVKHYAGSIAYGTNTPTSDTDFRGIFVADPINIRTPFYKVEEVNDTTEEDTKIYELSQFMKLFLDGNPNICESCFVDEKDIIFSTPAYQLLRENANALLSSKIAFTYSGYAFSQLKRIRGHARWLENPQSVEAPQQADFISLVHNFTPDKIFKLAFRQYGDGYQLVPFGNDLHGIYKSIPSHRTFDRIGALIINHETDNHKLGTPLFIVKFNRPEYEAAKLTHTNYWTWKTNRNKTRSALEEQFGLDTKHAMHLIRLLRTGAEALETGTIIVKRPDAEELLSIRNGAWSYEEIVSYAETMDKKIREELYPKTMLPKHPNIKLAAKLILEIQDLTWSR